MKSSEFRTGYMDTVSWHRNLRESAPCNVRRNNSAENGGEGNCQHSTDNFGTNAKRSSSRKREMFLGVVKEKGLRRPGIKVRIGLTIDITGADGERLGARAMYLGMLFYVGAKWRGRELFENL